MIQDFLTGMVIAAAVAAAGWFFGGPLAAMLLG